MGTSRRRFSREFNLEAVRMVAGGRHSVAQVARDLDLRAEMLRRWKRQVEQDGEQAFPGHGRLDMTEDFGQGAHSPASVPVPFAGVD